MKIVILFAKAGGGHESCAKSIKTSIDQAINLESGDKIEVELIDILSQTPLWQQQLFCQSYVFLTEKTPLLWSGLQILWKWDWLANLTSWPLKLQIWPILKEIIKQKPDKIICTYFLIDSWLEELQTQKLPGNSESIFMSSEQSENNLSAKSNFEKSKEFNSQSQIEVFDLDSNSRPKSNKIPIWTVVTDIFSPHTVWFLAKNCHYIVFSPQARDKALDRQVIAENILELTPFFNPKFGQIASENEIKNWKTQIFKNSINSKTIEPDSTHLVKNSQNTNNSELILEIDLNLPAPIQNITIKCQQWPTLLVVGGGESMPGGEKILKELLKLDLNFNLIFVCGRNQILQINCQKIVDSWQQNLPKSRAFQYAKNIQIHGFSQQLYEFMSLADLVICKAGPATILECVIQKKPILISHFIWEQEIGNRDFVVNNLLGYYEPKPAKLASLVKNLLSRPELLEQISQHYKKIKLENGLADLTNFIINC